MERHEFLARGCLWCSALLLVLGTGIAPCRSEPIVLNLTGFPRTGYSLAIGVGTPPQQLRVVLDTGSSNYALATYATTYQDDYFDTSKSETYDETTTEFGVTYLIGYWRAYLATDTLHIAHLPPRTVQMGAIYATSKFFHEGADYQGILGLAYPSIASPSSAVTPVFDSLVQTGAVSSDVFSMQLCGPVDKGPNLNIHKGGKFVVDGISSSLYTGNILYTPIQRTGFYEVAVSRVELNGVSLGFDCKDYNTPKAVVDSATSVLAFPKKIYNKVLSGIMTYVAENLDSSISCGGSGFWSQSDASACCILPSQTDKLFRGFPTITVTLPLNDESHREFVLSVPAQLYLQTVKSDQLDCFTFYIISSDVGTILGVALMEGYYVVFDREEGQIGFAASTCEVRDPAFQKPTIVGPTRARSNASCMYNTNTSSHSSRWIAIAASVGAGVVGFGVALAVWGLRRMGRIRRTAGQGAGDGRLVSQATHSRQAVRAVAHVVAAPVNAAPDVSGALEACGDDEETTTANTALLSNL